MKIKSKILSNLFHEKYGLKLGEFKRYNWNWKGQPTFKQPCPGNLKDILSDDHIW